MYTSRTGLILGFHGTDESVVDSVLRGDTELEFSKNAYDWLGHGVYFWDNSPGRALEWAYELSQRGIGKIKKPAVIGAIIDLGYCLDLLDYEKLEIVHKAYSILKTSLESSSTKLPINKGATEDLLQRELDCAVIETLHASLKSLEQDEYESVRGVFWEGEPLYPSAGFREKDHIQICVRNYDCIKGYFLPLRRITS